MSDKEKKISKLIEEFYDKGFHQRDDAAFDKQVTIKLDIYTVGYLTAIAKTFNMPLSHLIDEIIQDSMTPMMFSLEKPELEQCERLFDEYMISLEHSDKIKITQPVGGNSFRDIRQSKSLIDSANEQNTEEGE